MCVKIRSIQRRFSADEDRTLYQILQFTNISRIRQAGKEVQGICREFRAGQSVKLCLAVGKVACQQRNIFTTFAKGWQLNGYQVDTIKQIFAECAFRYHLAEVGIGGGYHTDIRLAGTAVSQHFKRLILQHTKQFHLAGRIEVTNFIQEDSTLVGKFKASYTVCCRIRKSPFLMAEHFAFKKALRDTAQVDLYKRLFHPLAVDVDGFGNQLLTRSTLTGNQYRGIGTRNACHRIQHFHQSLRFSDDMAAVQRLALFFRCIFRDGSQFKGCLDALQQSGIVPRLRDKVERACLHTLHGKLYTPPCCHQDNGYIGAEYFHLLQQSQSFFSRCGKGEVHVHQNEGRCLGTHHIHCFARSGNSLRLISCTFQHKTEGRTYGTIIIDYQYHKISLFYGLQK